MRTLCLRLLATLFLLLLGPWARAALSCTTPQSTGFSTAYAAAGVVPNVSQGTVNFTCTRSAATDATSMLLSADDGAHPAGGGQNQAQNGKKNNIFYEVYKDSACGSVWTSKVQANFWLIDLLNVLGTQSVSVSYWGCITLAGQLVSVGTYLDTVGMQVLDNKNHPFPGCTCKGSFDISIASPATFEITAAPGDVAFSYTAFGPVVYASTTFMTTGTLDLPYTMALDADSGVVTGLNYNLNIDSQASPVSARGSGAAQTHTINGSIPAGQAGTCTTGSCTSSRVHTLTITY